jgi:hypothetical protein
MPIDRNHTRVHSILLSFSSLALRTRLFASLLGESCFVFRHQLLRLLNGFRFFRIRACRDGRIAKPEAEFCKSATCCGFERALRIATLATAPWCLFRQFIDKWRSPVIDIMLEIAQASFWLSPQALPHD